MGGDQGTDFGDNADRASHRPRMTNETSKEELQLAWDEHEDEEEDTDGGNEGKHADKSSIDRGNTIDGEFNSEGRETRKGLAPVECAELFVPDFDDNGITVTTAITLSCRDDLPPDTGFGKRKTYIRLKDDEAAVVVGRNGRTKYKISKASGARLMLADNLILDLSGSPVERDRAELYVKLTLRQRQGAITVDFDETSRDDLTIMKIQPELVAGSGIVLRQLEEETDTLMFFAKQYNGVSKTNACHLVSIEARVDYDMKPDHPESQSAQHNDNTEVLLIFGSMKCRRSAQLRVMAIIEGRYPNHFSSQYRDTFESEGPDFYTERLPISRCDFKYANGKDGSTRKKLARAANCILEFVGPIAFIAGSRDEVKRGADYLGWLVKQRHGPVHVNDPTERSDCTSVTIPSRILRNALGVKPHAIRGIETDSHTFCVIDSERLGDRERLLIFGASEFHRERARGMIYDWLDKYGEYEAYYDPRSRVRRRSSYEDCKRRRREFGSRPAEADEREWRKRSNSPPPRDDRRR